MITAKEECRELYGDMGKYTKIIINPIEFIEGCEYPVAGTIELVDEDGNTIATIDFGDGTCDNIATKTVDGVTTDLFCQEKESIMNTEVMEKEKETETGIKLFS